MRKTTQRAVLALVFLLAAGSMAHAAGVTSGTSIDNFATMTASNVASATQSNTINTVVTSVYGLATNTFVDPADGSVTAGSTTDYLFKVYNNGNVSDSIGINVGVQTFSAGAGTTADWSVAVDDANPFAVGLTWQNSGGATATQGGDQATGAAAIAPGAYATFTVRITSAADAADSSTMSVPISFVTGNTPVGAYKGFNNTDYGGDQTVTRAAGTLGGASDLTSQVSGAVLTLSKTAVVTAPAGYTGGGTDPVPGARIAYTVEYGNSGAANALSVQVVDYIPTNTTYEAGTIYLDTVLKTDGGPDDECDYNITNAGAVTCDVGTVAPAATGSVEFSVTID